MKLLMGLPQINVYYSGHLPTCKTNNELKIQKRFLQLLVYWVLPNTNGINYNIVVFSYVCYGFDVLFFLAIKQVFKFTMFFGDLRCFLESGTRFKYYKLINTRSICIDYILFLVQINSYLKMTRRDRSVFFFDSRGPIFVYWNS